VKVLLRRIGCGTAIVVVVAAAAMLIWGLLFWVKEVRADRRRVAGLYWYDVRQDHRYDPSEANRVAVDLDAAGFDDPLPDSTWDTAFLQLAVEAAAGKDGPEPWLEVEGPGGGVVRQYFARGARGIRQLNLGTLLAGPRPSGSRFALRGGNLTWGEQGAELLLFRNASLDGKRVLVIATHPDDAEIAAYGLYAAHDSWIVTISAGENDDRRFEHLYDDPQERAVAKGRLRVWDSVTVPLLGGVPPERCVNLGYFNGTLDDLYDRRGEEVPDEHRGSADLHDYRKINVSSLLEGREGARSSWESLVADLELLLTRIDPDAIVAPHPLLDASSDHRFTTVALSQALERTGDRERPLLLYTNHLPATEYWPFGPADSIVSLPPWHDGTLPLRGVLSLPLDEAARRDKLFALDAMHDLRPTPRVAPVSSWDRIRGELGRTLDELRRDRADQYSYFRRAVRPNELFLVHTTADRFALVERFLDFWESRRKD
jgi:LmbE family N-acetylglucosaminyl deacetylase